MKIQEINGMPTEEGFYFVRESNKKYWQCLVRLSGNAPFLEISTEKTLFKTTDTIIDFSKCIFSEKLELTEI